MESPSIKAVKETGRIAPQARSDAGKLKERSKVGKTKFMIANMMRVEADEDEDVKSEAAAVDAEEASDQTAKDEMRMMRISEEPSEEAALEKMLMICMAEEAEEMMMMVMAEEAAATENGNKKRHLSTEKMLAEQNAREAEGTITQEEASDQTAKDEMKMMRISEEPSEEAAEEEMMMMCMAELAEEEMMMGIAEEAAATKNGKKKKKRHLTTEDMLADYDAREAERTIPPEANTDPNAYHACCLREEWDRLEGRIYGPFDQITSIPPSCFTNHYHHNPFASPQEILQIFSVKVGEIKKPLKWPLDVFGSVAARDDVDHNRIMVFHRERDNCQTLTKKDRYLTLTGPTRGVVTSVHPTLIEVNLKVKGTTESEDKDLSYLAIASFPGGPCYRSEASKLSSLELTYVRIDSCVEATISVKVKRGSWPGSRGLFTASTASIEGMEISLLAFKRDSLPVDEAGNIELSRRVVCVEFPHRKGKLVFSAQALRGSKDDVLRVRKVFTPKKAGKSKENLKVGYCLIEVTVKWSLIPNSKYDYDKAFGRG